MSPEPLLTVQQVAEKLALSETAVYALCGSGELPCRRLGVSKGRIRIEAGDLEDYLAATKSGPRITARTKTSGVSGGYSHLRAGGYRG